MYFQEHGPHVLDFLNPLVIRFLLDLSSANKGSTDTPGRSMKHVQKELFVSMEIPANKTITTFYWQATPM